MKSQGIRDFMVHLAASDFYVALFIFALALMLRLIAVLLLANYDTATGYESEEIALNLLSGRGYSMKFFSLEPVLTAHQYPVYTSFLALHFFLFGKNYFFVELTQSLIASGSCVLLFFLGRSLLDRSTGMLAGLLCASYPTYIYWTTRTQSLTLEIFVLILLLLALYRAGQSMKFVDWVLAGVVFGIGILAKTLYLVFFPGFMIWTWLLFRPSMMSLTKRAALFFAVGICMVAPWSIRNYMALDSFVLVSSNGGYNLWVGNNPAATGSMFTAEHEGMWNTVDDEMRDELYALPDAEKNKLFKKRARNYIKADPVRFLSLIPARLTAVWWFDPYMPSDYPLFRKVVYILLLVPALLGMLLGLKKWRELSVFYLIYLSMCASYAVYYGGARFRYLIEFSFVLFAAHLLMTSFRKISGRSLDL